MAGIAFFFIYTLFSQYREEEFQQRQKEKIKSTLFFLSEIEKADKELAEAIDRLTIHDLYNEKLLIFDHNKKLMYSSIDDTKVQYSKMILDRLSPQNEWFESKDELYDVVGLYFENEGNSYYGISKAYDKFGYSKLNYLKLVLLTSFLLISLAVIIISYLLSKKITQPLETVTQKISSYNFDSEFSPLEFEDSKNEIAVLAGQFNKLMKRMNEVFAFQKHAIHHISHELKTPISILVSNFERIENEKNPEKLKALIQNQKEDTKNLSEIINALLEISKAESGNELQKEKFRLDELIFDVADELKNIYPDFQFLIEYSNIEDEKHLFIDANHRLIRSAVTNLMVNCIQYSDDGKAKITLSSDGAELVVTFINHGAGIGSEEQQYLFQHFFRGRNSQGKRGFGLGLVFVQKILGIHGGHIAYTYTDEENNIFKTSFPLS